MNDYSPSDNARVRARENSSIIRVNKKQHFLRIEITFVISEQ